jgi:hypothetical protein
MNLKTGVYERLVNTVLDRALCPLPGDTKTLQAILDRPDRNFLLDFHFPMAIVGPAHPPSLCFLGSTLNFGGFFLYERAK